MNDKSSKTGHKSNYPLKPFQLCFICTVSLLFFHFLPVFFFRHCFSPTQMSRNRTKNSENPTKEEGEELSKKNRGLNIEGYPIEGLSIGGHETCIILPTLNLAFDIGRCPQRAISQDFLFISHAHMDHIVTILLLFLLLPLGFSQFSSSCFWVSLCLQYFFVLFYGL